MRYVPNKQLALVQTIVLNEIKVHIGKHKNITVSETVLLMFGLLSILSRKCPRECKKLLEVIQLHYMPFQQKTVTTAAGSEWESLGGELVTSTGSSLPRPRHLTC